jgi:RNA polymerase sigma-70 factor (ECF subfamily)
MDEIALIHSAQRGDLDAFNSLVLVYQGSLFNTALRILNDEELAADLTQEAFLSAFRGLNTFRGGSFKAWLMRTVTNACYDELRRKKRRPTTRLEPEGSDGDEMDTPRWMADPALSPEGQAEADELEHAIQHCLENLPLEFRTVVVMADIQGLDYSEVAVATHAPLGTIKSRLARARLRLRECLQGFRELLPSAFRLQEEPTR